MHQFINRMGSRPTAESKSSLGKQRDKIFKAISSFNAEAVKFLGVDAFNECCYGPIDLCGTDFEEEWDDPIDPPVIPTDCARPESSSIALPSALPQQSSHRISLSRLMNKELELRKGHANDCLAEIRTIIGQQAFQYKKILRPAHNKSNRTRARSSIQNVQRTLMLKSRLYKRTRKAMLSCNIDLDKLDSVYKELTSNDIRVSTAVDSPNVAGSTRTYLSWIWTSHQGVTADDNHLTECELFSVCLNLAHPTKTVYRVHWLRARAQLHRWQEEVALTRNEMHWAINYFTSRQRQWFLWQYSHSDMTPGHHVYAERQKAMWAEIREQARQLFKDNWADFDSDESVFI